MDKLKWTMVTRLEYLAAGGKPVRTEMGICADLNEKATSYSAALLRAAMMTHPRYTGNPLYPIPCPNTTLNSYDAFYMTENLWLGDYGALRRDFAAHAAKYLREQGYV